MDNNLDENSINFYVSSFASGLEIYEYVQDTEFIKSKKIELTEIRSPAKLEIITSGPDTILKYC